MKKNHLLGIFNAQMIQLLGTSAADRQDRHALASAERGSRLRLVMAMRGWVNRTSWKIRHFEDLIDDKALVSNGFPSASFKMVSTTRPFYLYYQAIHSPRIISR